MLITEKFIASPPQYLDQRIALQCIHSVVHLKHLMSYFGYNYFWVLEDEYII